MSPLNVTLFGKPIVTVLSVTAVSISFAVPSIAKVSVPTATVSVVLPSPIVKELLNPDIAVST